MISGVLYGPDRLTLTGVGLLLKEDVTRRLHEDCRLAACSSHDALERVAPSSPAWHVACVDIEDGSGMPRVHDSRAVLGDVELVLVVDEGVSPMTYIRPGVMPCGVVQKAARQDLVREVMSDVANHLIDILGSGRDGAGFAIEGKEGITRISYERIVCFESVAKRISVRLAREQYSYYDTLDHLQESLPPQFVRCHRSYIVNLNRATKLVLSDNTIHMDDGSQIPVSRSYKARVKELMG